MMTEPTANPEDVRSRTNIALEDEEITPHLEDATFDLAQSNDIGAIGETLRTQLEWRMAAIKILSYRKKERATSSHSLGSASKTYERRSTDELEEEVARICAKNGLTDPLHDPDRTASIDVPEVK